jgi:hypothetical protein
LLARVRSDHQVVGLSSMYHLCSRHQRYPSLRKMRAIACAAIMMMTCFFARGQQYSGGHVETLDLGVLPSIELASSGHDVDTCTGLTSRRTAAECALMSMGKRI